MDPLQFVHHKCLMNYAIATLYLDRKNTYIRKLFIYFSSVFNFIIPQHLIGNLSMLGLTLSTVGSCTFWPGNLSQSGSARTPPATPHWTMEFPTVMCSVHICLLCLLMTVFHHEVSRWHDCGGMWLDESACLLSEKTEESSPHSTEEPSRASWVATSLSGFGLYCTGSQDLTTAASAKLSALWRIHFIPSHGLLLSGRRYRSIRTNTTHQTPQL